MLSVQEVARRLSVCDRTVYKWIDAGIIEGKKLGGVIRIFESSLPTSKREEKVGKK